MWLLMLNSIEQDVKILGVKHWNAKALGRNHWKNTFALVSV